jgi:hypothetical protein
MSLEWVSTDSDMRFKLVDTEQNDKTVVGLQRGLGCWYVTYFQRNIPYEYKPFFGTEEEAKAWLLAIVRLQ